jgi:hypothetical protein
MQWAFYYKYADIAIVLLVGSVVDGGSDTKDDALSHSHVVSDILYIIIIKFETMLIL